MWDEKKQRLFDELRSQADVEELTPDKREQLDQLIHELEQDEWQRFGSTLDASHQEQERLQADIQHLHAQNARLIALAERYTDLIARARGQLNILANERDELRAEYDRVMQ